jgi:hypothetical protein
MPDYEPLDLTAACNAPATVAVPPPPTGHQILRGLPFLIGPPTGDGPCLVALGPGGHAEPVAIPIGRPAWSVVFAHRLLESAIPANGPVGEVVAEYLFHYADGQVVAAPVRERFEIGVIPRTDLPAPDSLAWMVAATPFIAVADQHDSTHPRDGGPWSLAGRRQMEALRGLPVGFQLWAWQNPRPEQPLRAIELIQCGRRVAIGGITLGHVDEHPFVRAGLKTVRIDATHPEDADRPFKIAVEVDRGLATYPYPLPTSTAAEFLADPVPGWGEPLNEHASPAYVEVAATPSATVTVRQDGEALGSVRWGDLLREGVVEASARLRLTWIDRERNWVQTTVVDDATGRPIPCRVHFRSPDGVPYQPHGHHGHVNSNHGSWHMDVGGDVRLGQTSYAYIDGRCQGWLPRGEVLVEVARGFEYEPLRTTVTIAPGQQHLTLRLKRWADMNAERWYSGDTHVHFLSTQGSHLEARAEDVNVINLLLSQWGSLFTNTEEWTGRPSVSDDGWTIVYATQENRQHMMGHLTLLGLKDVIMPWCSDGPTEAELGGTMEVALSHWADACRAQGGTVIIPHLAFPNGEAPALIATGRVDGVEMLWQGEYFHNEYYRYLNSGYRLPIVGGTDKMSNEVPVGIYRTYVHIPPDEEFSYESWCRNLARGRTFHSGGPILRLSVDGRQVGDTLTLPGNGGTVEVEATADSTAPIHTLQIVQEGRVVAETVEPGGSRSLRLREHLPIDRHTWLAARVGGPGYYNSRRTLCGFNCGVFAHTSPVYIACGGDWWMYDHATTQYMLTMVDGCLSYIRQSSWQHEPHTVTHPHGEADHLAYLERPFLEAREALHRLMHRHGVAH